MSKYLTTEELHQLFIQCHQKVTTDTRKLNNDSIFFALKGEKFDANTFAKQAIEQGCKFAIVDNEQVSDNHTIFLVKDVLQSLQDLATYHRKKLAIPIIGITGSNAKTTHKELIQAVLSKKYKVYATFGNLNNHIGVPLTLLAITPQHEIGIVEMGANHQGEIAQLCEIADPDFGLITNIGNAHLEGFGGPEGVKKGKGELYHYLRNKAGKIFVNADDIVLMEMTKGLQVITYGLNKMYDVYGSSIKHSEYVEFNWNQKNKDLQNQPLVKTHLFGHYNFINALCAACVGNYFGVSEQNINDALAAYLPEMNRSQVKKTTDNTLILDAYNANPSSMKLALENFANQNLQNKVLVLGDMFELGEYSNDEHRKILMQLVSLHFNHVYLVGENFMKHIQDFSQFQFFNNSDDLAMYFSVHPMKNHTILIKGSRGIKLEKIVGFL